MWYGAHLIIASESIDNDERQVVVEEPIYLIEAIDINEAEIKARSIAEKIASSNVSLHKSLKSKNVSYGCRKIVAISNLDLDNDTRPGDGSEISFEIFNFSNSQDFENYRKNLSIRAEFFTPEVAVEPKV